MKNAIVIILVIILIPTILLGALYFLVPPFQGMANGMLKNAPGGIGDYFEGIPTEEETLSQVNRVALYMLDVDAERAVDKLNLIEKEDARIYDMVLKAMLRLDPNGTEKILAKMREQKIKDNVILNTIDQINEEQIASAKERATHIETLNDLGALREIQVILDEEIEGTKIVAAIFEHLSDEKIVGVIAHLNETDVRAIFSEMSLKRVMAIKGLRQKQDVLASQLTQTAKLLSSKDASELSSVLGSTETYTIDQLVTIYESLGPKRAGEVLAKVKDDGFTLALTHAIVDQQMLNNGVDNFSKDLFKALNIYKDYDDNLNELVVIYEKVDEKKTAETIKRLYWNTGNSKNYTLDNGDTITISDEKLALDLLKSFPTKKIAMILSNLDNSISTEISTKLALPNLK